MQCEDEDSKSTDSGGQRSLEMTWKDMGIMASVQFPSSKPDFQGGR